MNRQLVTIALHCMIVMQATSMPVKKRDLDVLGSNTPSSNPNEKEHKSQSRPNTSTSSSSSYSAKQPSLITAAQSVTPTEEKKSQQSIHHHSYHSNRDGSRNESHQHQHHSYAHHKDTSKLGAHSSHHRALMDHHTKFEVTLGPL